MTTKCFTPLLGKRLRVTTLDECGNYPASSTPDSNLATDGFITVSLSSEVEDGAEIITKKADGSLCVNEKFADSFKRFTVGMEFCGVNPSLMAMISNAEPYNDYAGDVAGFTVPEGVIDKQFAFELWTGMAGAVCVPGADSAGGYLLLPFVQGGVLGDIEVTGEDAVNFSLTGAYTKGGNAWDVGPYDVLLTGGAAAEVQRVTITGGPNGGGFTLTFNGHTTASIAYNATAADVQAALLLLPNLDPGDVVCAGGALPGAFVTITFGGTYVNENPPEMTATNNLTGGTNPQVAVTTTVQGAGAGSAGPLPTPLDPFDHLLMIETGVAPPPSACAPSAMP